MARVDPLYGQVAPNVSRFQIAGDARRMYPISALGGLVGPDTAYVRQVDGGVELKNLVPLNDSLAQFGQDVAFGLTFGVRLGVTTNSGGNILRNGVGGSIVPTYVRILSNNPLVFANGEMITRDTIPATTPTNNPNPATDSYGAIYELFTVGAVTVASFSSAASSLVSSAALSTLALTTSYAAYTNGAVTPLPAAGDIIRIQNTGATLFSYHRITNIAGTTINIAPSTVFANAGASTFWLLRAGGSASGSTHTRFIPVVDSATNSRYIYYTSFIGTGAAQSYGGGVLQAIKYDGTTNQTSHFMAPRQVAGVDWYANDIASYKGFLLYGYRGSVGWSVAGFPTSFTTAFGNTDLPASNLTVVSLSDQFVAFEYLGEQLIAIFTNSIWQVQATGTVPEFAFYKLPEPISVSTISTNAARKSVSARGAVYYSADTGLMELAGGLANSVSMPVNSLLVATPSGGSTTAVRDLTWEPFTDSIIATFYGTNSNSTQFLYSMAYHRPTKTWYQPDFTWIGTTLYGITGGSIMAPQDGNQVGSVPSADLLLYDAVQETVVDVCAAFGGPANITTNGTHNATWSWKSPVVSLGDEYGCIEGLQVDGNLGTGISTFEFWGGKSPYAMVQRDTGTINALGNRDLMGKKIDDPFVQVRLANSGNNPIKQFVGVNLYTVGRGR